MTASIKNAAMLTLCLILPPLGWLFMYKYSTYDRKTNVAIAAACLAFFVYANISAGNVDNIFGSRAGYGEQLTAETFREKFNSAARRLAPNLNLTINAPFTDEKIFRYEFAPKLTLEGTTNDGSVTELKIFAAPTNQDESFQTLNVFGLMIAALNPELDAEDRGEVMRDLRMLKEVSTEGSYDWTTARGNVTYSVHADRGNVTFTAAIK
ncbi:MAG: hypothetical protein SR2Q5_05975 [Quinella sp. 2Q5]|nr:hypothetical protein [Quinella sp. 2Q5]